jgi:hypothetical protein
MAHFAEIDENNIVKQVLVVNNNELMENGEEKEHKGVAFLQSLFGHDKWKQTSYNGNIRKNYAGIGFSYDSTRDAFIPPKPFDSWLLDENTCIWIPPQPQPGDGNIYTWDESTLSWTVVD